MELLWPVFTENKTIFLKSPWFKSCFYENRNALKIALKSGLAHDRRTFQHLRNKVVKELRKAKAKFITDLINDAKGNSREVWENINRVQKIIKTIKALNYKFMEV